MIRAAFLLALMAGQALAEAPVLVLSSGSDRVEMTAAEVDWTEGRQVGTDVQITLEFQPGAAAKVATFTRAHAGREVVLAICGRELFRARLVEPITGGRMAIGAMKGREARKLARIVEGLELCP